MEKNNTNGQNSVATSAEELKNALAPIYKQEGEITINGRRIVSGKDENYGLWVFMVFYTEYEFEYYGCSERSLEEVAEIIWDSEFEEE